MAIARGWVNERFTHIDESFVVTSKPEYYNCIAHALGHASGLIWPSRQDGDWPDDIPCTDRISSFTEMLGRHGYKPCQTSEIEDGYEKIALYSKDGFVQHAARQRPSGRWTSKLGYCGYDIAHHGLGDLEGKRYGFAKHFFRRVLTDS
jgi:hypothetical protein